MTTVLSTIDLTIGYRLSHRVNKTIGESITVELRPGELVCLLGPNGAGKSTLIRTLAGMQVPLSGSVWLGDDDVHRLPVRELARRLSVVLTDRVDAGRLSVYDLVALGRYPHTNWRGHLSRNDDEAIRWALQVTRADPLASRAVSELSDGERQRVMIARALAQEPDIMILDEPTAFLDLPRRVEIIGLLRKLAHESERVFLAATHDLDIALRVADRMWLMAPNGRLRIGIPEELVLDGSFQAVFDSDGIEFDNTTGSFTMTTHFSHRVGLFGSGLAAFWTARAFEREGFEVIEGGVHIPLRVEVRPEGGITTWHVKTDRVTTILSRLPEAIELSRHIVNEQTGIGAA